MKSIADTRRERLLMAIDDKLDGSRAAFTRLMGWASTPGRIQRYITDKKSSRPIGGKLAREIEKKLGLEPYSMDTPVPPPPGPGAGMRIMPASNPMADQLLALFNELSPDGQDLLIIRANRLYTEEHPDEVSQTNPWGSRTLKVVLPPEPK